MTRSERFAQISELRATGLTHRQIADELGITISGVRNILNDPDGSKQRARRERYRGVCAKCGGPTDGSNGFVGQPKHCAKCLPGGNTTFWSRERILAALRDFYHRHGFAPRVYDWHPALAGNAVAKAEAIRFKSERSYPYQNAVYAAFGSWAAMLEAAGFPARPTGGYARHGEAGLGRVQRNVLAALSASPRPLRKRELTRFAVGVAPDSTVDYALRGLIRRGLVARVGYGVYEAVRESESGSLPLAA